MVLNEKGEKVELYCYPLPAYSLRLDDAWLLLNRLRDEKKAGRDPHSNWYAVIMRLSRIPVEHEAHEVAKLICWTILEILTGEDYAANVGVDLLPTVST